MRVYRLWTAEEDDLLRENYKTKGATWCKSQLPNRTFAAVRVRATKLEITKLRFGDFTAEENAFLQRHFPAYGVDKCATSLNRTKGNISEALRELGLLPQVVAHTAPLLFSTSRHSTLYSTAQLDLLESIGLELGCHRLDWDEAVTLRDHVRAGELRFVRQRLKALRRQLLEAA